MNNLNESVPPPTSPDQPPLTPYDPPQPAPQAEAWRRALKVIAHAELERHASVTGARTGRAWARRGSH
jgi:hypothetical protein